MRSTYINKNNRTTFLIFIQFMVKHLIQKSAYRLSHSRHSCLLLYYNYYNLLLSNTDKDLYTNPHHSLQRLALLSPFY